MARTNSNPAIYSVIHYKDGSTKRLVFQKAGSSAPSRFVVAPKPAAKKAAPKAKKATPKVESVGSSN